MPARRRGGEPGRPGAEKAADLLVGELGRRHIEHSGDQPLGDQRLHRLAAVAGGVEDQHLEAGALEHRARPLDARRRDAEHRGGDERLVGGRALPDADRSPGRPSPRAACDSTSRLIRLMPRMSTTELSMKMSLSPTNCRTVPDASVLSITFGHAERQRPHRRRADRGAGRAAEAEHAAELAARRMPARERRGARRRQRHGVAAVGPLPDRLEARAGQLEDALAGDVGLNGRLAERTDVDQGHRHVRRMSGRPDEIGFRALGVERGEEVDGRHRRLELVPGNGAVWTASRRLPSSV